MQMFRKKITAIVRCWQHCIRIHGLGIKSHIYRAKNKRIVYDQLAGNNACENADMLLQLIN